jgi:nitroimidazol reductase NimA-like FMN-containing flavoprotein (pyridoxamine 5'-phosphate oxidase superfamily)
MLIHELSREECLGALAHARLGRLACARDDQPYVVPVYFAFRTDTSGAPYLYGFTTPGQKVHWMRANPLVCVEWDEVAGYNRWVSVIAFGLYEELPDTPDVGQDRQHTRPPARATPPVATSSDDSDLGQERLRAYDLLREHTGWWQPGYAARAADGHRDPARSDSPLYYRIRVDRVTGRRATPDATEVAGSVAAAPARGAGGWVRKALRGAAGIVLGWRRRSP